MNSYTTCGPAHRGLLLPDTLKLLRHGHDELASNALESLLKLSDDNEKGSQCPVPKTDLYTLLEAAHRDDPNLQKFWDQTRSVPEWVDWEQLERGQDFFYQYAVANIVGFALQGFIGENAAAFGPAEVLVRTGGLSPKNLMRRVMETFQWVLEVTESLESLKPRGKGHASTIKVRLLHASARRKINQLALKRPAYFDLDKYGTPINIYDSILTITFFCCNPLWIQLPSFGIYPEQQEIGDFVALYRYLSYLLGTPDEYFSSPEQAQMTMQTMLSEKKAPSESSRKIAHSFIDCLADQEPLFVSRGFIEAGSRRMNPKQLCDDLALGNPSLIHYASFEGFRWTVRLLSHAQRWSSRLDNIVVTVSHTQRMLAHQGHSKLTAT